MSAPAASLPGAADRATRHSVSESAWHRARTAAVVVADTDLSLLDIDGLDAETFLQGQLSNDVKALHAGRGHWTSYNSPKGRMLATLFLVRRGSEAFSALVAADLEEAIRRRLAMFVLRSKVTVAPSGRRLVGVGGPDGHNALAASLGVAPAPGEYLEHGGWSAIALPDGRLVVATPASAADATLASLARHAEPVDRDVWEWLGVRAGVPVVTAATQDQFVPQAANWDAIGGLDFRKGCYPGQEIVARTQYLGRLRERLFAFSADVAPPAPGTRVYGAPFGDQAAGSIVNSAPSPEGGSEFLAVVQTAAAESGAIAIGAPDGPRARREPLPYALPEPVAPRGRLPK